MTEEIRLIAEARHLRRRKGWAVMAFFLGACALGFGLMGAASKKTGKAVFLAVSSASLATTVCGQKNLKKISQREREICKRLSQIQRERS